MSHTAHVESHTAPVEVVEPAVAEPVAAVKEKKKYNVSKVSAEEFVKIWQAAETLEEVAEKCGQTVVSCTSRAIRYRKLGVLLKKFEGARRPRLDVAHLNEIVVAGS
jgi:hypothetical protein